MRYLILGGTRFLGRHLINSALKRGHEVTIFTRGREKTGVPEGVEQLIGDRENNLEALRGRNWDRVIDTSGYTPWEVEASARLLADKVKHYTFISSISVYADLEKPKMDEATQVCTITEEALEEVKAAGGRDAVMQYYGELKYLCELEAKMAMGGRALNIRPGLIVGQFDPTDRFTYWIDRISKGGKVLCPGRKDKTVQFIHAGDLADFIIKASEREVIGEFNATGPDYALTMESFLEKCREVSGGDAELMWASEEFLLENNVQYWSEMPLWVPDSLNNPGFLDADISKALGAGLSFRPLADTIKDTLDYAASRPQDHSFRAGISREREEELIKLMK